MVIRSKNIFLLATQHENNSFKIVTIQYLTINYLCTSENHNRNNPNLQTKREDKTQSVEANSCTSALQSLLQIDRKTNTDPREERKYFCKEKGGDE